MGRIGLASCKHYRVLANKRCSSAPSAEAIARQPYSLGHARAFMGHSTSHTWQGQARRGAMDERIRHNPKQQSVKNSRTIDDAIGAAGC